jgi:hypothetical protein
MSATVAALFVERGGAYWDLPGVDPWDEARDARKYAGPHSVVAHPPCERHGKYANGGPGFRGAVRPTPGDDDGCFVAALNAVRDYGGVLEHPAGSLAWKLHGLRTPPRGGGWVAAGDGIGWTCCVEQGHYGHRARKATWLYAAVVAIAGLDASPGHYLPRLEWGACTPAASVNSTPQALPAGRRASRTGIVQRMSRKQRRATPPAFRDLLLSIARSASAGGLAGMEPKSDSLPATPADPGEPGR